MVFINASRPLNRKSMLGRRIAWAAAAIILPVFVFRGINSTWINQHEACTQDSSKSSIGSILAASSLDFALYTEPKSHYCLPEVAVTKAAIFKSQQEKSPRWSGCGGTKFFNEYARVNPTGPKIHFDIGCNKGYTSAKFFGLWASELGFNPKSLHLQPGMPCDTCGDCHEEIEGVKNPPEQMQVYCFEPSQANFARLLVTRELFFNGSYQHAQWLTVNMAMTNSSAIAKFSRDCLRDTMCSLGGLGSNYDIIATSTVDKFAADNDITYIDILKIDTEGYDATVLQGAAQLLSKGAVGLLVFEYHRLGVWKEYKLEQVINWLDAISYICYFDSQGDEATGMYVRITGCWDNQFEFYKWSNVVCLKTDSALMHFLENNSI